MDYLPKGQPTRAQHFHSSAFLASLEYQDLKIEAFVAIATIVPKQLGLDSAWPIGGDFVFSFYQGAYQMGWYQNYQREQKPNTDQVATEIQGLTAYWMLMKATDSFVGANYYYQLGVILFDSTATIATTSTYAVVGADSTIAKPATIEATTTTATTTEAV